MSSIGSLLLIALLVGVAFRSAKRPPARRPGPAPQPHGIGKETHEEDVDEAPEEQCELSHQGEASYDSREGLPASVKPVSVHALNREAEKARAAGISEGPTVPASRTRLSASDMRRAVVMSEILSRPVSMRDTNE